MVVFVFGSNLAGRHGKGAALVARKKHGAIYGQGRGLQGNSYAIPTKDGALNPLPLVQIKRYVRDFLIFAYQHPEMIFEISRVGCGLARFVPTQIAPLFVDHPDNCVFPEDFQEVLDDLHK